MKSIQQWIHSKLWIYFSLIFFAIGLLIATIAITILGVLEYHNLLATFNHYPFLRWLLPIIICFIIGVITASLVSLVILKPISQLKQQMQQVIQSDFSIQVDENQPIQEVAELYHAFNLMVKELNGIERFQADFTSTISHEFKTPLSNIQGYAQLLQSPKITPDEMSQYLHKIQHATEQLTTLVNHILELTRLENQSIAFNQSHFRLDEQIRESILSLQPQWEKQNLQLKLDLPTTYVLGNELLLYQVWTNLIQNAIQYNWKGGTLSVQINQYAKHIQVIICDTGVGIAPKDLRHITERFYQSDTSRHTKGNGLGLAITQKIVKLHQGSIHFTSQLHQGTQVIVTIPTDDISSS